MSKPTYILSDLSCEGMEAGIYEIALDSGLFDTDETGSLKNGQLTIQTAQWPENSGQIVWFKAINNGTDDLQIIAHGVAYKA